MFLLPSKKKWNHLYAGTPHHLFSIVTWGASGSKWLAKTLNAHPEVYCQHAINTTWSAFSKSKFLDGLDYLRILSLSGSSNAFAGDVHGISREKIPEIRAVLKDKFSSAVIIREPISRIQSNLALAESSNYKGWNIRYVYKIIFKKKLKLIEKTPKSLSFIHFANLLNAIIEEKQLNCPIFQMEKFTKESAYLGKIFDCISNGKIKVSPTWVNEVIQFKKSNSHLQQQKSELDSWQMEVVRKIVEPKAWELYADLGYPIPSFID